VSGSGRRFAHGSHSALRPDEVDEVASLCQPFDRMVLNQFP
jgi:hypothetical protein